MVVDGGDGYAYPRTRPGEDGGQALPRLVCGRALTYNVSVLLVLLRKRLVTSPVPNWSMNGCLGSGFGCSHRTRDGLVLANCIDVKDGPFREYLVDELAKRVDHRCAMTLTDFRAHKRAVIREGQVRSGDRHERDDRHRHDDPCRWVLGWANERKIAALHAERAELQPELTAVAAELSHLMAQRDAPEANLEGLARPVGPTAGTKGRRPAQWHRS